jgi:hypothetical protein
MLLNYNIGLIYLQYVMGAYQSKYELDGFLLRAICGEDTK